MPSRGGLLAFATAAALLSGCAAPSGEPGSPSHPATTPEQDMNAVIVVHQSLARAYENGDADAFVALLRPSPDLLIFHPRLENRFDGVEEIRSQMGRMFARLGGAKWTDVHPQVVVDGDVAWLTGQVLIEAPGLEYPFVGRATEIYVRGDDGWRLGHAHWSEDPTAP